MPGPTPRAAAYTLQTLTPAPVGWRVVSWDGVRHQVEAVYLFGLGTTPSSGTPPRIVSFTYTPGHDWQCCEEQGDFCGLLPPGWDLATYEAQDPQGHVPTQASGPGQAPNAERI